MQTLIEAKSLKMQFDGYLALKDLSLRLNKGEVLGLLGPNGAGKTTAIHIFLGLLQATSGFVAILGHNPLKEWKKIAERVNFSSAYVQLPSNLKVIENLKIYARLYDIPHYNDRIEELLETFDLIKLRHRITGALSSGEKTRLNLCKSLLNEPDLLLLDEPTASLDPEMADKVRTLLRRIQDERKMGILYTSHNMAEIELMCDRIMFLHNGVIMAEGTHQSLKKEFNMKSLEDLFIHLVRMETGVSHGA